MKSAHALALAAVFAAELILFCVVTSRHYAWIYPRWYDQLQYLREAYDGYEKAQNSGFAQGVRQTLSRGSPQGSLHGILALFVFEVAGPSRVAALSLNLFAFLALQAATFLGVRRLSGSFPIAWAAVALLAALHFPWSGGPGSVIDFRLDWMAACAYGVALGAAIAGNGFRSTRWAVILGAAVGTTILIRYLTAVYFGLIFLALLSWLLIRRDRKIRCGRLTLAAFVAGAISGPALWHSRRAIYSYYWIKPITGPERELFYSHLGVISKVKWLFADLLIDKIGLAVTVLGLGAAVALLVLRANRSTRAGSSVSPSFSLGSAWTLILVFLAAPVAILALYPEKVPQTVSILIPGTVWIIILAWICLARRVAQGAVAAIGGAVVLVGALLFVGGETKKTETDQMTADFRNINALNDYLYYRAEESGLVNPRVAVTWILDGAGAEVFSVVGYERHHGPLRFFATLPTGLFATTREIVMRGLADSDFVCLVNRAFVNWPYDRQMAELLPEMRRWCASNLKHVGDLDTTEFSVFVYERPALERPIRGSAVELGAMMKAAARGPANCEAIPPAAPLFVSPLRVLGSTRDEFQYALAAAYSPLRYGAEGLPEGLHFNSQTVEIRGRFSRAGTFAARITAANSAGSTSADLAIHVEDLATYAMLSAPKACTVGAPVEISYGAFDADGKLDFIEVTDLTARKTLCRIPVPEGSKRSWQGSYRLTFARPGPQVIRLRTVRFDPNGKEKYSFVDHECTIDVAP